MLTRSFLQVTLTSLALSAMGTVVIYLFFALVFWGIWPSHEADQQFVGVMLRLFFIVSTISIATSKPNFWEKDL